MINKATIIGRLGQDPEVKHLDGNRSVCKFSIASDDSYKDKNGTKVPVTDWHNIEMWDGLAKVAEKYLKKGSQIYVEGKLKTKSWDKDGVKHYRTKIRVSVMKMLDSNSSESSSASSGEKEDDLPF